MSKYYRVHTADIALSKKSSWVCCEDGTKYSPKENAILKSTGQPIPLEVHLVKKMFDGVLISAEVKK